MGSILVLISFFMLAIIYTLLENSFVIYYGKGENIWKI